MVHRIARAYGRLPHEILSLDPVEFELAALCLDAADGQCAADVERYGAMAVLDIRG